MTTAVAEYLEAIQAWRFLTSKQLSLLLCRSEKTSQKIIAQLLAQNLIVELGSVTGFQGDWLKGKWFTTPQRLRTLKEKKHRICVRTSKGFKLPAHNLVTSHSAGWILKKLPYVEFFSKSTLRHKNGWRRRQLFRNRKLTNRDTYVPDALGMYDKKYFRLEICLHRVPHSHFMDMIHICQDSFPILIICYPGKKEYYWNLIPFYRHRFTIVELNDDDSLQDFLNHFSSTEKEQVE